MLLETNIDSLNTDLLSSVFEKQVRNITLSSSNSNTIVIIFENDIINMNIFELVPMIKMWAFKEGFILTSEPYFCDVTKRGETRSNFFDFQGQDENEAIFLAAEWVLKNK